MVAKAIKEHIKKISLIGLKSKNQPTGYYQQQTTEISEVIYHELNTLQQPMGLIK